MYNPNNEKIMDKTWNMKFIEVRVSDHLGQHLAEFKNIWVTV